MSIEESLEAPLARGAYICLADAAAARGRLRARMPAGPRIGPCSVVPFPSERVSSVPASAAERVRRSVGLRKKGARWRGPAMLLLPALSAALCAWQSQAREPTDAQLIAVIRQYGAHLPHPVDPVTGRAVRVERTPREWVVTLIDPRRLDPPRRRYVAGGRSAYHIDRATLRVVSVMVAQ